MNFSPNFAGIVSALKHIIENGIAGASGGGGGGGGGSTAEKQDEQINLLNQLDIDTTNINNSIGSQNDSAASSDNPPLASLLSLIRRLLQRLTTLLPQSNGKLSVESDIVPVFEVTNLSANAINADLLPSTNVATYRFVSVQVFGAFVGRFDFEGSNDNSNWNKLNIEQKASGGYNNPFAFLPGIYTFPACTKFIRIRVYEYTSGTIQANAIFYKQSPNPTHVTGYFTGDVSARGTVAHDSPVGGLPPVILGAVARLGNITPVQNDDVARLICTLNGALINMPYTMPEQSIQGCTANITNVAAVELIAAALSVRNYISSLTISNPGNSDVNVEIRDGSTTIHRIFVKALDTKDLSFLVPLKSSTGTAINVVVNSASASNTTVNFVGYRAP